MAPPILLTKPNTNGGLSERMAARAGINLPKLNMSRAFPTNIVSSATEGQPSPTTGKISFLQNYNSSSMTVSLSNKIDDEPLEDVPKEFAFEPPLSQNPLIFQVQKTRD